jgi:hypothetical protein
LRERRDACRGVVVQLASAAPPAVGSQRGRCDCAGGRPARRAARAQRCGRFACARARDAPTRKPQRQLASDRAASSLAFGCTRPRAAGTAAIRADGVRDGARQARQRARGCRSRRGRHDERRGAGRPRRASATKSAIVKSVSWPTAETTGSTDSTIARATTSERPRSSIERRRGDDQHVDLGACVRDADRLGDRLGGPDALNRRRVTMTRAPASGA